MKIFAYSLLALPAAANLDAIRMLDKRSVCQTTDWLHGLTLISSSVSVLSSRFASIGAYPPCSAVSLAPLLTAANNLVSRINSEAVVISACSPSVNDAENVIFYMTETLNPAFAGLSSAITSKKAQITCNSLQAVVTNEASSISSAANNYGSALSAKVPVLQQSRVFIIIRCIIIIIEAIIKKVAP